MIVAVCLNPAVDVTYRVAELRPGASHRVSSVTIRAGGKATNVARVLARLGVRARLVAPLGAGDRFRDDYPGALVGVEIAGETRRSVTVVDADDATVFNEPGPVLAAPEWESLLAAVRSQLTAGDLLVLAGSVPPGAPDDAYAQLITLARSLRVGTLLDADGPQFAHGLAAGPDLVKPNVHETAALLGRSLDSTGDVHAAALELMARGAGTALISRGAEGLVVAGPDGAWAASSPVRLSGNPTGAGDALTAAVAAGLQKGLAWPDILPSAIATSAAAVVVDVAGDIDEATRTKTLPQVEVTPL